MTPELTAPATPAVPSQLLVQCPADGPLELVPLRRLDALLTRLLAARLDARLAAGTAPETSRLLAARAGRLTSPEHRADLADGLDEVLARARSTSGLLDARVPVARTEVLDAAPLLGDLAAALRSASPVGAGAVARVQALLTDGASPVYTGRGLAARLTALRDELTRPGL